MNIILAAFTETREDMLAVNDDKQEENKPVSYLFYDGTIKITEIFTPF